jgi:hypothetical protein
MNPILPLYGVESLIHRTPDIYLSELQDAHSVLCRYARNQVVELNRASS